MIQLEAGSTLLTCSKLHSHTGMTIWVARMCIVEENTSLGRKWEGCVFLLMRYFISK